jgi:hypothetical protein
MDPESPKLTDSSESGSGTQVHTIIEIIPLNLKVLDNLSKQSRCRKKKQNKFIYSIDCPPKQHSVAGKMPYTAPHPHPRGTQGLKIQSRQIRLARKLCG